MNNNIPFEQNRIPRIVYSTDNGQLYQITPSAAVPTTHTPSTECHTNHICQHVLSPNGHCSISQCSNPWVPHTASGLSTGNLSTRLPTYSTSGQFVPISTYHQPELVPTIVEPLFTPPPTRHFLSPFTGLSYLSHDIPNENQSVFSSHIASSPQLNRHALHLPLTSVYSHGNLQHPLIFPVSSSNINVTPLLSNKLTTTSNQLIETTHLTGVTQPYDYNTIYTVAPAVQLRPLSPSEVHTYIQPGGEEPNNNQDCIPVTCLVDQEHKDNKQLGSATDNLPVSPIIKNTTKFEFGNLKTRTSCPNSPLLPIIEHQHEELDSCHLTDSPIVREKKTELISSPSLCSFSPVFPSAPLVNSPPSFRSFGSLKLKDQNIDICDNTAVLEGNGLTEKEKSNFVENTRMYPNTRNQQQPGYPYPPANYPQQPQLPYVPGCPPGLEYLAQLDRLLVKQQVELIEAIIGFETCNQYKAFNAWGHHIFNLGEESGCLMRNCCRFERGFVVHVSDAMGREVMRFSRDCRCFAHIPCLGTCCGFSLLVEAPIGQLIGKVEQRSTCWTPYYHIVDANNNLLYSIQGGWCFCCKCCNVEFKISDHQGREVGMITKDWGGLLRELFTDATHFSVTFPFNVPPQHKALIFGAAVLIDFSFYEEHQSRLWSGN